MEEISFEIEEDLYNQVKEILEPIGITVEECIERFMRFCADPNNREDVKKMFDEWKKEIEE